MELVAAAKLRRAEARIEALRPYAERMRELMIGTARATPSRGFPLLEERENASSVAIVPLTGDRGLAGGFNANLIKEGRNLLARLDREGTETVLRIVGRKGLGYFRYVGRPIESSRTDFTDRPTAENAADLVNDLIGQFERGEIDAVYVVYAKFNSALSTPPTTVKVLPVTPPEAKSDGKGGLRHDYLLFPSAEAILEQLLPLYVRNAVYRALVETAAAEQGARRTAMKNATDNAGDILNVLRRTYNRARQAQITQEIAEIVGGSAALEG